MERWLLYYLSNGGAIKSPCKWPMPHFILIYGILIEFVSVNWKILLFNVCIAVAYQPVFNETVSLWPWGGGEGITLDLVWRQGWGFGVKVFREHEGKEGPQRLGLITTVNTENGRIPFNYVGQMMHTWPKTLQTWRHIYWSAIPLNNSWFNPPQKKKTICLFMVLEI